MHVKHYSPSNTPNMPMFAFSNPVLLGCMRARCLVNNSIFLTENRHIIFNILQGIVSLKRTRMEVEDDFFYFIDEQFNDIETSDLSLVNTTKSCRRSHQQKAENI